MKTLLVFIFLLSGCASEKLCRKTWDGRYFRCMTPKELCSESPTRCGYDVDTD